LTYGDAEGLLRDYEARIDDQLVQARQLQSAMESVSATHQVRDGAIEVTVDSSGGLVDLYLNEYAIRLGPGELAREIVTCSRGAQAKLAQKMNRAVSSVLGSGTQTGEFVTQSFAEKFGDADAESAPQRREDDW
jgi:YbaB/EbfC DNA-binding family